MQLSGLNTQGTLVGKVKTRIKRCLSHLMGREKKIDWKLKGACWNCSDRGHYKNKCPKPIKETGSNNRNSPKGSGSANAIVELDDEDEAAFFADLDDNDELPELLSNHESDLDAEEHSDDWFSEMGDDAECIN